MTEFEKLRPEFLKYFRYNKRTGKLFWKVKPHHRARITIGEEAGTLSALGYIHVGLHRKVHKAHRIIWLMIHGKMPKKGKDIDHKNRDRSCNKLTNFRLANKSQTCWNRKIQTTNKSGVKGVNLKASGRWQACITVNKRWICLGRFDTLKQAAKARRTAEKKYHGEFAI